MAWIRTALPVDSRFDTAVTCRVRARRSSPPPATPESRSRRKADARTKPASTSDVSSRQASGSSLMTDRSDEGTSAAQDAGRGPVDDVARTGSRSARIRRSSLKERGRRSPRLDQGPKFITGHLRSRCRRSAHARHALTVDTVCRLSTQERTDMLERAVNQRAPATGAASPCSRRFGQEAELAEHRELVDHVPVLGE